MAIENRMEYIFYKKIFIEILAERKRNVGGGDATRSSYIIL